MLRSAARQPPGFLLVAGLLAIAGPAQARQDFDGSWSIEVVTERGDCDRAYRYYIVINNSAVHVKSMTGEVSPEVAGRIAPSGRIDTRIGAPDDPVSIRGQLGSRMGDGAWTAPARGCAGRWAAEKR